MSCLSVNLAFWAVSSALIFCKLACAKLVLLRNLLNIGILKFNPKFSDKLLFKSGSYAITDRAKEVLGKVAKVLNAQPDIEFLVEGHTDSIPITSPGIQDNWDLSVKRATTVVRVLQDGYGLDPKRMTAAGRGQYLPLMDNSTPEGRAANRRTRIVILPQLDQFFKLLETKK